MSEPELVELLAADLEWLAEQERVIFGAGAWSPSLIREDFASGYTRYRAVRVEGKLAAYAVYGYDGDAFSLLNLAVLPEHRRQGLARLLVDDFLADAREQGEREAWLEVATINTAAIALYRAYGFTDVRVRPRYYQPGNLDALVMRLPL